MAVHYQKRRVEERPTREMGKDELLGLLSEAEQEAARKQRAATADPFAIDTRELDARVFRRLSPIRVTGSAPVIPISPSVPDEPTELVAPLPTGRARVAAWTAVISVVVTSLVLLFLVLAK